MFRKIFDFFYDKLKPASGELSEKQIDKLAEFLSEFARAALSYSINFVFRRRDDEAQAQVSEEKQLNIRKEFLFFFLYLSERLLCFRLGRRVSAGYTKDKLMSFLLAATADFIDQLDKSPETGSVLRDFIGYLKILKKDIPTSEWIGDNYEQRQMEYSKYKFVEDGKRIVENIADKSGLNWKFAQKMVSLAGHEEDENLKEQFYNYSWLFAKEMLSAKAKF